MKKVDALLLDYAAYHRTTGNIVCHFIGIPAIMFGLFSMLQTLSIGPVSVAEILIAVSVLYYLTLDLRIAAGMLVVAAGLDALAYAAGDYRIGFAVFVIGWIFQGIGHAVYEKRSPAFLRNMLHLLVGPIFLVNEALRLRPIQKPERTESVS